MSSRVHVLSDTLYKSTSGIYSDTATRNRYITVIITTRTITNIKYAYVYYYEVDLFFLQFFFFFFLLGTYCNYFQLDAADQIFYLMVELS